MTRGDVRLAIRPLKPSWGELARSQLYAHFDGEPGRLSQGSRAIAELPGYGYRRVHASMEQGNR